MSLAPRLEVRTTQSLVMTPQLRQAIQLLALSNLELEAHIGEALESNPLLELGEGEILTAEPIDAHGSAEGGADEAIGSGEMALDIDPEVAGAEYETGECVAAGSEWEGSMTGASPSLAGAGGDEGTRERAAGSQSLADHLHAQLPGRAADAREAIVAARIIGELDEAGYLRTALEELAAELGVPTAEVERALALVQDLEPAGVGARSLAECLALQAREADRYDPCMARLIDNLELVAAGDIARLRRLCEVDDEDLADMLAELRGYDPKPGHQIGGAEAAPVTPDILVRPGRAGGWDIRLNEASLPRLAINRGYYLDLRGGCADGAARGWLDGRLTEANWLLRALDQRQRTILKTAAAIVAHQADFFRRGVAAMRPLTLRQIAEATELHESTVSRVTNNKFLHCARGTFALRYFFPSGVGAREEGTAASSAAIKASLRAMIDAESPAAILSDDTLMARLKDEGFDLARRTVAKYRESLGIGSSVQRRRQKRLRDYVG